MTFYVTESTREHYHTYKFLSTNNDLSSKKAFSFMLTKFHRIDLKQIEPQPDFTEF